MGITFIGMGSRSSGQVRGYQLISNVRKYNFYDKIGFDIIDRPVAELHKLQKSNPSISEIDWNALCSDYVDFYIVTNSIAKLHMTKVTNKKVYVIPHHVVSEKLIKKDVEARPKIVGYLGTKDQLMERDKIIEFCKNNNLEFYENHPRDREECIKDLKKIDIGIVYLDRNSRTEYVMKFKPNQKLSNFQCFGIPSIITGYESYKEFGGTDAYILVDDAKGLEQSLTTLLNNKKVRTDIQKNGYDASERLLLNNVIDIYTTIEKQ